MGCAIGLVPVVFADDGTESEAFQIQEGTAILGYITDADWTTADIGISVCTSNPQTAAELAAATFVELFESDGTTETGITGAVASTAYRSPAEIKGWHWAKLLSSAAQAGGPTTVVVSLGKAM